VVGGRLTVYGRGDPRKRASAACPNPLQFAVQ
jgi:hypothetical protein